MLAFLYFQRGMGEKGDKIYILTFDFLRMNWWMDEWLNEWMNEWMNEWIN